MRTLFIFLSLFASTAFASPFLVSDPSQDAIGIQFEVLENPRLSK
jgi:hypothetical protein